MPATGEAQHASKPPEHPPPNPPPTHPFLLLCGAVNAAIRLALSLCTPPTAVPLRRKGKPRPAPRINIHASAEVSAAAQEVLVLRQIKFRNEFRVARRRRDALSGIQESKSLIESEEECLMAMRISVAAVLVLQSYVRAVLVRRHEEGSVPPYLRKGWVPPTPAEFDERLAALGARFPTVPEAAIEDALHACVGHAGYAVAELEKALDAFTRNRAV